MKDHLEILGLFDEDKDTLPSSLIRSSLVRIRYLSPTLRVLMVHIVWCLGWKAGISWSTKLDLTVDCKGLIWGENVDFSKRRFDDLIEKLCEKEHSKNVWYTRFATLMIEHLLRKDFKTHHYTLSKVLRSTLKLVTKNHVLMRCLWLNTCVKLLVSMRTI